MEAFSKIAPHLNHPFVLIGFILIFVFVSVVKLLIKAGIIVPIRRGDSFTVVTKILNYSFYISILVIIVGFTSTILQKYAEERESERLYQFKKEHEEHIENLYRGGNSTKRINSWWLAVMRLQNLKVSSEGKTISQINFEEKIKNASSVGEYKDYYVKVAPNKKMDFYIKFELYIDNSLTGIMYPIGVTTTWDKNIIYEIDSGITVAQEKGRQAFAKFYNIDFTVNSPTTPGEDYYIILIAGAMTDVYQLFFFNTEKKYSPNDLWHVSYSEFENKLLGGHIKHSFIHLNGLEEEALWPIIAIKVQVSNN